MDQPIPDSFLARLAGMADRHPFELCLSSWWMLAGALLIVSGLSEFAPSPSFLVLPNWFALVMGIPLFLGGVGTVCAMVCRYTDLALRWRIERLSLQLAVAGLIPYTVAVLWYRPSSLLPAGMALSMAVGAALRIRASVRMEARIRRARGD